MALRTTLLAAGLYVFGAGATTPDSPERSFTIFVPATNHEVFSTEEPVYDTYRSVKDFIARWPRDTACEDSCIHSIAEQIDFTREMVLLIAPRGRGQDTYDVVIHSVAELDGVLEVGFIELRHGGPRDGVLCGVLLVMPQPAVALLVPQTSAPVRFLRRRADVVCEHATEVSSAE